MANFINPWANNQWGQGSEEGDKFNVENAEVVEVGVIVQNHERISNGLNKIGIFTIYYNETSYEISSEGAYIIASGLIVSCDEDYSMYDDVKWFQTVNTNDPKEGKQNYDIDVRDGSTSIFYSDDPLVRKQIEKTFSDRNISGRYKFADFPTRGVNKEITWVAELSLIGVDANNTKHVLGTLIWGFGYNFGSNEPNNINVFEIEATKNHLILLNS